MSIVTTSPGGLSPRVRGNPGVAHEERRDIGSIPACAGEPALSKHLTFPLGVYPRVCGGTGLDVLPRLVRQGLSPRVRGNLVPVVDVGQLGGLSPRVRGNQASISVSADVKGSIPACAGEPRRGAALTTTGRVYPRVCGGTC